jgi:hypothetical protein
MNAKKQVLLENLIVAQPVKEISVLLWNPKGAPLVLAEWETGVQI